jgi:hypothetical protein
MSSFFNFYYPKHLLRQGAQALGKEFPATAPRVIQGTIKFPQSDGHKGEVATRTQDVRVYGSPRVDLMSQSSTVYQTFCQVLFLH